jgi:hypothetical protein
MGAVVGGQAVRRGGRSERRQLRESAAGSGFLVKKRSSMATWKYSHAARWMRQRRLLGMRQPPSWKRPIFLDVEMELIAAGVQ